MIRLDLKSAPFWLDLPAGVRLKLQPLTTGLMAAARADATVQALAADAAPEVQALVLAKAVARAAILDWDGVGDADGNPLPVSPEAVDALLDLWPVFEGFQLGYVAKGLLVAQEGNGCAPSPAGTGAGAATTADPAAANAETARPV
ncbi:MAG: hypothetical protein ACK4GM_02335 [Tabrizicola sp.]